MKPPTLKTTSIREKVKVHLLSKHLRMFPKSEKTLDVGCGRGFSLKVNPDFYCVDSDQDCITHLQNLGAKAFLSDVSGALPFEDNYFHNVFTHDVLEHLERDQMFNLFNETRRIIQPGGLFMNVVPNQKGFALGLTPEVGHIRFIALDEVREAAAQSAFELIDHWYTPLPRAFSELFSHNKLVTICRAI
jgi:SAM-dependent methyltransferase